MDVFCGPVAYRGEQATTCTWLVVQNLQLSDTFNCHPTQSLHQICTELKLA